MPRVYDLVMTHLLDTDGLFIHSVQKECASRGMDFFMVEPEWVGVFTEKFQAGAVSAKSWLNMHCEHHLPEDPYRRLLDLAEARGGFMIDPPSTARAAFNKAQLHPLLESAGFPVPPTVIVQREAVAGFELDDGAKELLGVPFVIKPAMGYGRRGVMLDALSGQDVRRVAQTWPDEAYLLQKRMEPGRSTAAPGRPFYFRLFHVEGRVWSAWWDCGTDAYALPTEAEGGWPAFEAMKALVLRLATLTGMRFFSTEILLDRDSRPCLIDYVNDQCHMLSQGADPARGVPDALVVEIARALVNTAAKGIGKG